MFTEQLSEEKLREIEEIAAGWGKLLARETFPNGPGLDVSLAEMEEVAARACRAIVRGAVETMTGDQAERLAEEEPCPTCGRMCPVRREPRRVVVRGGDATLDEPVGHCPTCRRDFFPQRPALKIDGHGYRPTILHRVLHMAGVTSSFDVAEEALKVVGEISISDRQINKLTSEIGQQMAQDRDARTQ